MPVIMLLTVGALLVGLGGWLTTLIALFLAGWLAVQRARVRRIKMAERVAINAATAARADRQHYALLAGDYFIGSYGDYPPAI
jgi:hypothetical protein